MLSAILTLEDGTQETVCTNESWLVRKNGAYTAPKAFDARIKPSEFINAECIPDIWRAVTAPIPIRYEEEISPENSEFSLSPFQEKEGVLELDMIWGGFVQVKAETEGELSVKVICRETESRTPPEELIFSGSGT